MQIKVAFDKENMKKRKKSKKGNIKKKSPILCANIIASDIKILEAIIKLAEPLIKRCTEHSQIRIIVWITILAWNLSLFSEGERENYEGIIMKSLPEQVPAQEIATLLESIDLLSAKKKKYYPHLTDFIISHDLTVSENRITLTVNSTSTNENIREENIV